MRVVVLADTHIAPGGRRRLPDEVYEALDAADVVIHAGDIVTPELLHELEGFAPAHAVLGNNDDAVLAGLLPERLEVDLEGLRVGVVHDSGPARGRAGRLRRRFPECEVVVFGHSHVPLCATGEGEQLLFNPGSPTDRRLQPSPTFGLLEVAGGRVLAADIIPLPVRRRG